jgi:hypothetical protein
MSAARRQGVFMRQSIYGLDEYEMLQNLAGYILEQPSIPTPPPQIRMWGYVVFVTGTVGTPDVNQIVPVQPSLKEAQYKGLQLKPIGRLVPVVTPQPKLNASLTVRNLQPVRSGQAYRITSPPVRGLVTLELAEALETVFEKFAGDRNFTPENRLEISFSRGFKAGSMQIENPTFYQRQRLADQQWVFQAHQDHILVAR